MKHETSLSISIWSGTPDNLTWTWRKVDNWFMCYLLLPGVNNWGRFPLFDVETASAALAIMADIYTDTDTTDDPLERARYKQIQQELTRNLEPF